MDNIPMKFQATEKNITGGIHTALSSGKTPDEILQVIHEKNPTWQTGLDSLRSQGKTSNDILTQIINDNKDVFAKKYSRATPALQTKVSGQENAAREAASPLGISKNFIEAVPGAVSGIVGGTIKSAIQAGETVADTPTVFATGHGTGMSVNYPGIGKTTSYQNQAEQEIAKLNPNDPDYNIKVAEIASSKVGETASGLGDIAMLSEAPQALRYIKGSLENLGLKSQDILNKALDTKLSKTIIKNITERIVPSAESLTQTQLEDVANGSYRGINMQQVGNKNIIKTSPEMQKAVIENVPHLTGNEQPLELSQKIRNAAIDSAKRLDKNLAEFDKTNPKPDISSIASKFEEVKPTAPSLPEQGLNGKISTQAYNKYVNEMDAFENAPKTKGEKQITKELADANIPSTPKQKQLIDWLSGKIKSKMTRVELNQLSRDIGIYAKDISPGMYEPGSSEGNVSLRKTVSYLRDMIDKQIIDSTPEEVLKSAKKTQSLLYDAADSSMLRATRTGGTETSGQMSARILKGGLKKAGRVGLYGAGLVGINALGGNVLSRSLNKLIGQ